MTEETPDAASATDEAPEDGDRDRSHFADLDDGAGCTEIWEHLSEKRERERESESDGG